MILPAANPGCCDAVAEASVEEQIGVGPQRDLAAGCDRGTERQIRLVSASAWNVPEPLTGLRKLLPPEPISIVPVSIVATEIKLVPPPDLISVPALVSDVELELELELMLALLAMV